MNLIGIRFNNLVITGIAPSYITINEKGRQSHRRVVICLCDCGRTCKAHLLLLKRGKVRKCKACAYANRPQSTLRQTAIERWFKLTIVDRAKKTGIVLKLTAESWYLIATGNCFYCNKSPEYKQIYKGKFSINEGIWVNGLDRIDSAKGYTIDNILPCCKDCNTAKASLSVDEFLNLCERVYLNKDTIRKQT